MPTRKPTDADRFRRTRAAHRDETAEDYVEAIADLIETSGEARVTDLAEMMGVSHVTVSRIVSRLCDEGLVEKKPHCPMALTSRGRRLAAQVRERHEVVFSFLKSIGVPVKQAEIDSEGIEHHVSDATIKAMRRMLSDKGTSSGA